jgi:general stress protein YciG
MASSKQGDEARSGISRRGFASMDPNLQRAIASEGGRAAHRSGNAHEFTTEEARRAGRMSRKNSANHGADQAAGATPPVANSEKQGAD